MEGPDYSYSVRFGPGRLAGGVLVWNQIHARSQTPTMPIRFHCKRCNQLLGIASRKAGSEIQCPKCGISQVVPTEEAATAAMAMSQFAKTALVADNPAELVVYEDEPSAIEMPRTRRGDPPAAAPATASKTPSAPAAAEQAGTESPPPADVAIPAGQGVPQGMILFQRRTYYVQGVLFLLLAVAAFGSGYFIGRGDATVKLENELEEASRVRVPIEGKLFYFPGTGQVAGDFGAVVIALPEGRFPEKPLPIDGIRPQDPPPDEGQRTVRLIRELGGAYARADADGNFLTEAPDQGKYRLLIISNHAARPQGVEVDEVDLVEMEKYFALADHLINRFKYRWELREINIGTNPIEVDFGRDGQK